MTGCQCKKSQSSFFYAIKRRRRFNSLAKTTFQVLTRFLSLLFAVSSPTFGIVYGLDKNTVMIQRKQTHFYAIFSYHRHNLKLPSGYGSIQENEFITEFKVKKVQCINNIKLWLAIKCRWLVWILTKLLVSQGATTDVSCLSYPFRKLTFILKFPQKSVLFLFCTLQKM